MGIIRFFHQLFRPNCDCNICATPKCDVCEELKMQINYLRDENRRLLDSIITKPEISEPVQVETKKPVTTGYMAWRVRQQYLEAEDREKLRLIKEKEKEKQANTMSTEELEKELGITPEEPISERA